MFTFLIWGALCASAACGAGLIGRSPLSLSVSVPFSFIVGGILGWMTVPTMNFVFMAPWFFLFMGYFFGTTVAVGFNASGDTGNELKSAVPILVGILAFVVFLCVSLTMTHGIFHWREYRALLGSPEAAVTFEKDVAAIDTKRLRVVNEAYATRIADKMLGEQQGLGSQTNLGRMQIAQLNGCFDATNVGAKASANVCFEHELVWVAPLVHSGFFRWTSNGATHDYALVSASDPERKLLVHQVNGKSLNLKYHREGAHFGDNLMRHIRENGYLGQGLTDVNFELDDAGNPWWVVVTIEKRIGFSGIDATGVLIVDPATGDIKRYGMNVVPQWVDRVQPEDIAENQFDNWGKYGRGWMNSWTSHLGVVQTSTDDLHLVEGPDGRTYWYTGIASYGNDQSTSGFVLIDTKTKETKIYQVPGAMETAAQASAENVPGVKERGYTAGEPILYNMDGTPTYFMTLNGGDSVPRMYAFVSVRDYQIVGAAERILDAKRRYETTLRGKGSAAFEQVAKNAIAYTIAIVRIAADSTANGWWILTTIEKKTVELFVPAALSNETKFAKEGDKASIAIETGDTAANSSVVKFDDLELTLQ